MDLDHFSVKGDMYKTNLIRYVLVIGILMMVQPLLAQDNSVTNRFFQAGAAKSNITPPLGEPIVGNWDAPPADYIHDEIFARCLVLDDGETRLGLVLVDNVGVKQEVFDAAKKMIHGATGLPPTQILMASTHTHSSISAGGTGEKRRAWTEDEPLDAYQSFMASRIADGMQVALKNLEPARIGWGSGSVPQHVFNRRWKMKPGTPMPNPLGGDDLAVMNPGVAHPNLLEPAGPTDPEVVYISVQAIDGRPLALLANYSLHYVGGVPKGHISADYFGVFADMIQEHLQADGQHPPFVAMMSNGTSGDVNNINFKGPSVRPTLWEDESGGRGCGKGNSEKLSRYWIPGLGEARGQTGTSYTKGKKTRSGIVEICKRGAGKTRIGDRATQVGKNIC